MHRIWTFYKERLLDTFASTNSSPSKECSPSPPQRLRVLIAPSGFKECMGPEEVADCIEDGFCRVLDVGKNDSKSTVLRKIPVHDGGEGFCKAVVAAHQGEIREARVTGPDLQPIDSHFGLIGADKTTAVLDMAAAAGLRLVPRDCRDPTITTTYGVGELIVAALDAGCSKIVVGCGDSGTSDAGAGMLQALGARLLDKDGRELPVARGGGSLSELETICLETLHPRLRDGKTKIEIEATCNIKNILCGPTGVARIYGPQKGATSDQVETLSYALERFAKAASRIVGRDLSQLPGSGASGGLGAGLLVLGSRLRPRAEAVDEYFGLRSLFDEPWHLVVTAEGSLDYQSAKGKMTVEIAKRAKERGIPVIVLAGTIGPGAESVYGTGIRAFLSIMDGPSSLDDAIKDAPRLIRNGAEKAMRIMQLGISLQEKGRSAEEPQVAPARARRVPTPQDLTKRLVLSRDLGGGLGCAKLM